jgi:hypothetical protein
MQKRAGSNRQMRKLIKNETTLTMQYKDDITAAKTLLSTGSYLSHFEQAVAEMVLSTENQLN